MKEQYHRQITKDALHPYLEVSALETIIVSNLGQDALIYQFGHDHFHYDNNSFKVADEYVEELRQATCSALRQADAVVARQSFGRLTHTVQDFYAHSNYVSLWLERHPDTSAQEIEPELPELRSDSRLCSGRLYYPLEALSFVTALKPFVLPLLPHDSHAWMNLDAPGQLGFEYAFSAAVKRTRAEFLHITEKLTVPQTALFTGIRRIDV